MATDNTVTLIGNLTDDPELRFTANGGSEAGTALPDPASRTTGGEVPRCESNLPGPPRPRPRTPNPSPLCTCTAGSGSPKRLDAKLADCQQVPTCLQIGAGRGWIESL